MLLFRKDKTAKAPPKIQTPPKEPAPAPPPPSRQSMPPPRREVVHHSTLLLLDKFELPQQPRGYWDNKEVFETPSSKDEHSRRTVFDPESSARPVQNRYRREIRVRKEEREARSLQEGWLEGPGEQVVQVLEELEDTNNDLRDAGRWENHLMVKREMRIANARSSWFGKEAEDERTCRMAVEAALRSVRHPAWTVEFEPQTPEQLDSSARSIRAERRISTSSIMTMGSLAPSRENRLSILSTTTSRTTPRSSIMSMTQASTASSPISSGMPSPTFSTASGKGGFWKGTSAGSPTTEQPNPIALPPPALTH
ncbi:hypothetical protein BZA05DRAFT_447017 [Tricharina praecox]|uniref:uncharacterized protein n=1 Tax=Tricharina praecox TaxID=43433 RepID=UPI002220E128|nr:uncharacterized protein BZA05DRAFT_447017 [Tricharina praecox]KAI5847531.1 hypothetical protein BZA05DRAFT_447017 [Tricharina praecox]